MLGFLRFINAIVSLLIGWSTVVMTLVLLVWLVWDYLAGPLFGKLSIPAPPDIWSFLFVPAWLGLIVLVFFITLYVIKPVGMVVRGVLRGIQYDKIDAGSPLFQSVKHIADKMDEKAPHIYIYNSAAPNAFAVSSLFSNALAISVGLLEDLEWDEIEWVLAHELAHIRYLDSIAASFWLASAQTMQIVWNIHYWIVRVLVESAIILRLSLLFIVFFTWPLIALNYSVLFVFRVAKECFHLLDLYVSRAMEHRADRIASVNQGVAPGIRALAKLHSGVEPSLGGLFSTHPPNARRTRRLKKMLEEEGTGSRPRW